MTAALVEIDRPRLGRSLGLAGLSNVVRILAGFGASVAVARALGPAGRGEMSFVLNSLSLLLMFSAAGSFAAITRISSAGLARPQDLYRPSLRVGLVLGSAWGAAFVALYVALRTSLFGGVAPLAIALVAVALPPTVVTNYWSGVAAASDRLVAYSAAAAAGSIGYLASTLALLAVGARCPWVFVSLWIAWSLLPGLVLVPLYAQSSRSGTVTWRSLARVALPLGLGDIAMLLVLRVDVFAVKGFRGFAEVGLYAVATALAELVLQVGVTLRQALLSRQANVDRSALPALLARTSRLVFASGLVVALVLGFVARPAIRVVFGDAYLPAAAAVLLLVPGTILVAVQGPLRDYLVVERRARPADCAAVLSLVANVVLNVVLLRHHTFLVAAATSTLAYVFNFSACAWVFSRTTNTRIRTLLIPTRADFAALAARST